MAVPALGKPGRRACDHLCDEGCGIHAERPGECRAFNCLWLRGAVEGGDATRPDVLGVMLDHFTHTADGTAHTLAFELWAGALDTHAARAVLDALCAEHDVAVSYRDGRWSTRSRRDDHV